MDISVSGSLFNKSVRGYILAVIFVSHQLILVDFGHIIPSFNIGPELRLQITYLPNVTEAFEQISLISHFHL